MWQIVIGSFLLLIVNFGVEVITFDVCGVLR